MTEHEPTSGQITLTSRPVNISVSTPESDDDAKHRRRKDLIMFAVVIAALGIATCGSAYLAFLVPATDLNHADKEWARSILASVVAGMVGFAFGKK